MAKKTKFKPASRKKILSESAAKIISNKETLFLNIVLLICAAVLFGMKNFAIILLAVAILYFMIRPAKWLYFKVKPALLVISYPVRKLWRMGNVILGRFVAMWQSIIARLGSWMRRNEKILWKLSIIGFVTFFVLWGAYRVYMLNIKGDLQVYNVVRLHIERGGPPVNTVVAKTTTDFLLEPVHVDNGRSLVSANRIGRFEVGQGVLGQSARVTSVSRNIDIHSGMFIVRFSEPINGTVMVMRRFNGVFLPLEAELPEGARVIAQDGRRQVVRGIEEGTEIVVR